MRPWAILVVAVIAVVGFGALLGAAIVVGAMEQEETW